MQKILPKVNIFLLCLLGLFAVYSIFFTPVAWDGGYYLTVSKYMSQGLKPYHDFNLSYTYNTFCLFVIPFLFTSNVPVIVFVIMQVIISFVTCIILFKMFKNILGDVSGWPLFLTLFYMLLQFSYGGFLIRLELLTNLFVISAMYFFFKKEPITWLQGIGIGFFATEAFFTKQYGATTILVFGLLALVYVGFVLKQWKGFASIITGFMIGGVLNYLLIRYYFDTTLPELLSQITGGGYGLRSIATMVAESFSLMFRTGAFLMLVLFFIKTPRPATFIQGADKFQWVALLLVIPAFFLLCIQFYFQHYDHYAQLFFPYIILLYCIVVRMYKENELVLKVILGSTIIVMCFCGVKCFTQLFFLNRQEEKELAIRIKKIVGTKKTFLATNFELYYLADLEPVSKKKYGLSFPNGMTFEKINSIIREAEVVIIPIDTYQAVIEIYQVHVKDTTVVGNLVVIEK